MNCTFSYLHVSATPSEPSSLSLYTTSDVVNHLEVQCLDQPPPSMVSIPIALGDRTVYVIPVDSSNILSPHTPAVVHKTLLIFNQSTKQFALTQETAAPVAVALKKTFDTLNKPSAALQVITEQSLDLLCNPTDRLDQRIIYLTHLHVGCNNLQLIATWNTLTQNLPLAKLPTLLQDLNIRTQFTVSAFLNSIFGKIIPTKANTPQESFGKVKRVPGQHPSFVYYKSSIEDIATIYSYGAFKGSGTTKQVRLLVPISATEPHLVISTPRKRESPEHQQCTNANFHDEAILEKQVSSILLQAGAQHVLPVTLVTTNNKIRMICPLCNRADLRQLMQQSSFSQKVMSSIALQAITAVHELHTLTDRCHIDIKLTNFFAHEPTKDLFMVYLGDFAYSLTRIQDEVAVEHYTSSYPPPELLEAREKKAPTLKLRTSFDLWNLGLVLFQLRFPAHLWMIKPFYFQTSSHATSIAWIHKLQTVCAMAQGDARAAAISALLSIDPTQRPTTASLLASLCNNQL